MGDPAGIGPEIIVRTLQRPELYRICRPLIVGDARLLARTARSLGLPVPPAGAGSRSGSGSARMRIAEILDEVRLPPRLDPGRATAAGGRAAARCIEAAAGLALAGTVSGIVTCPINKTALARAGLKNWGHTEILRKQAGAKRVAMLFWSPRLSVVLHSIHLSLARAIGRVKEREVLDTILFVDAEWARLFGARPRLAVAGLNPHAGEGGLMGREEAREIAPAIARARRRGVKASGPWPPDTIFRRAAAGEFDLVLAMHHDQGLGPIKLLDADHAVNVTLGLPFIRTSVDHGTAYDIAGRGLADPTNLLEAIRLAARLAGARP